jgi:hypothetical protein
MRAGKVARRTGEAFLLVVAGLAAAVTGIVVGEVVVTGEVPRVDAVLGSAPVSSTPASASPPPGQQTTTRLAEEAPSTSVAATTVTPTSALVRTGEVASTVVPPTTQAPPTTTAASGVTVTLEGNPIPGDGEWDAAVTVAVAGPGGAPVPRATVTAVWSGAVPVAASEPSGGDGLAEFRLEGIEGAWVSFTVIDVVAEGLDYDADRSITSIVVSGQ